MNSDAQLTEIITSLKESLSDPSKGPKIIDQLLASLHALEQENANNFALIALIKMLRSIAAYLKSNFKSFHPDSLGDMEFIYQKALKLLQTPSPDKTSVREIFNQSHDRFKLLKFKISGRQIFSKEEVTELSSAVLAMEWEISDQTISNFRFVIDSMLKKTRPNTVLNSFLKIIHSTGGYIGKQKSKAVADAVFFLKSSFNSFEKVALSPDMKMASKKEILESEIKAFKTLKAKIIQSVGTTAAADMESNGFTPALSHIKPEADSTGDMELTQLPDDYQESLPAEEDYEEIEPALSGMQSSNGSSPDVMDDLFTAKESPADELLDAIHLMDVHGQSEEQAIQMLDDSQSEQGIHAFTPKRMESEPIPEIGDRLDEFFSVDEGRPASTEGHPVEEESEFTALNKDDTPQFSPTPELPPESVEQHIEITTDTESTEQESIIPFEDETTKEFFDEETETVIAERIQNLQSFFSKPEWKSDRWSLQSIQKECFNLKDDHPDESELNQLMDIIIDLSRALEESSQKLDQLTEGLDDDQPEPKGFFSKLKSIFSS